jgi:hypothetical protein
MDALAEYLLACVFADRLLHVERGMHAAREAFITFQVVEMADV